MGETTTINSKSICPQHLRLWTGESVQLGQASLITLSPPQCPSTPCDFNHHKTSFFLCALNWMQKCLYWGSLPAIFHFCSAGVGCGEKRNIRAKVRGNILKGGIWKRLMCHYAFFKVVGKPEETSSEIYIPKVTEYLHSSRSHERTCSLWSICLSPLQGMVSHGSRRAGGNLPALPRLVGSS